MKKYQNGLDTNHIRALRHASHFLQKHVAAIMGFDIIDRISHWEKGRSQPGLINTIKLCKIYGVTIDQLYPQLCQQIAQEIQENKNAILIQSDAGVSRDIPRILA